MDLLSLKKTQQHPVLLDATCYYHNIGLVCPTFPPKIVFFCCGFPDVFVLGYGICLYFDSIMKKSMKGAPDHLLTGCMTSSQQRQIFPLLARVQEVS